MTGDFDNYEDSNWAAESAESLSKNIFVEELNSLLKNLIYLYTVTSIYAYLSTGFDFSVSRYKPNNRGFQPGQNIIH